MSDKDKVFAGSIPAIYDAQLVPLIFQPYAEDLVRRLADRPVRRVLELAAGTGAVTRALAEKLRAESEIVATDLNQAMIDRAASRGTSRPVQWKQADALALPFEDQSFDAVVCQFGAMFFPDKPGAFAEARRVLKPGGVFLFNVWDRIANNDFAGIVTRTLAGLFPGNPPLFLERTPHGYHDPEKIRDDLAAGGFGNAELLTLSKSARGESATDVAFAFCQGTPLRGELEALGPDALAEGTLAVQRALAARFGTGAIKAKMQAIVVLAER